MDITIASLTFTRELLKKIWLKFVKDNEENKEICDLFTRWCEGTDQELEKAIKADVTWDKSGK